MPWLAGSTVMMRGVLVLRDMYATCRLGDRTAFSPRPYRKFCLTQSSTCMYVCEYEYVKNTSGGTHRILKVLYHGSLPYSRQINTLPLIGKQRCGLGVALIALLNWGKSCCGIWRSHKCTCPRMVKLQFLKRMW